MIRKLSNPPNPYHSQHVEYLDGSPPVAVEVYEEQAKTILSENDSPDLPFRWSVNPYRGCQHACAYCYARPYHEYLDLGAGTDFDTKLFVKVNAPELLKKAMQSDGWQREALHFSGVTDCYQPLEAVWEITRKCLQVCLEFQNPVCIATRSYLVARDAGLLAALNRVAQASVLFSIPFADDALAAEIEPYAPRPSRRFEAMQRLHEAGVPVGILVAPVIPGLTESHIPRLIERAAACGARSAAHIALRLPGSVGQIFMERLGAAAPLRVERVRRRLAEVRNGCIGESRFGHRMRGQGTYWESIERLFEVSCARYGIAGTPESNFLPGNRETPARGQQYQLPFE